MICTGIDVDEHRNIAHRLIVAGRQFGRTSLMTHRRLAWLMPPRIVVTQHFGSADKYRLYSREDARLLRWLRHRMLVDLVATRKFERWLSHFPKNRRGPKPRYCGTRVEDYRKVCKEYDLSKLVFLNQVNIDYNGFIAIGPREVGEVEQLPGGVHPDVWRVWVRKYQEYDQLT